MLVFPQKILPDCLLFAEEDFIPGQYVALHLLGIWLELSTGYRVLNYTKTEANSSAVILHLILGPAHCGDSQMSVCLIVHRNIS